MKVEYSITDVFTTNPFLSTTPIPWNLHWSTTVYELPLNLLALEFSPNYRNTQKKAHSFKKFVVSEEQKIRSPILTY